MILFLKIIILFTRKAMSFHISYRGWKTWLSACQWSQKSFGWWLFCTLCSKLSFWISGIISR